MDIILIAGLWLDGTAWAAVARELAAQGHHPIPLTLPGQGDGNRTATLADQRTAVLSAVDAAQGEPLVVGHSAACTLAWLAADARPAGVAGVALICPEFSPAQAQQWIDDGEIPELAAAEHLEFIDLDSGHWPMLSKAAELARVLSEIAAKSL